MTPEQEENAKTLLQFFETQATDAQCDMHYWVYRDPTDGPVPPKEQRGAHGCGTSACLAGWGALLLAPTEDVKDDQLSLEPHRCSLSVPWDFAAAYWEQQHYLVTPPKVERIDMSIEDMGRVVLGPEIGYWFIDTEGPWECGMKHREWMIAVLRKELGMDYDPKLRSKDEREDEDSYGYENEDRRDADD